MDWCNWWTMILICRTMSLWWGTVSESYPKQIQICTSGHGEALQNYSIPKINEKCPDSAINQLLHILYLILHDHTH
jgi:hypothetical protein